MYDEDYGYGGKLVSQLFVCGWVAALGICFLLFFGLIFGILYQGIKYIWYTICKWILLEINAIFFSMFALKYKGDIMFRVLLREKINDKNMKDIDIIMTTESLHKLLGRFQMKYGIPEELISDEGIEEIEYFKSLGAGKGIIGATVCYCRIGVDNKKNDVSVVPLDTTSYEKKEDPLDDRLKCLIDAGVATKY